MSLESDRYWARFLAKAREKQRLVRLICSTRDQVRRQRLGNKKPPCGGVLRRVTPADHN